MDLIIPLKANSDIFSSFVAAPLVLGSETTIHVLPGG